MSMRKYYDCKKTATEILADVHIFDTPEYKRLTFGILSACLYVCLCTSLAPLWLDKFYSCSVFNSLYSVDWVPNKS
jgi:hypothetical protein